MFKLNFEKAVIFVLIVILLVSTANIYSQYIMLVFHHNKDVISTTTIPSKYPVFPVPFVSGDTLYNSGNYKEAKEEYIKIKLSEGYSSQQKAIASFRLGMCYFKLKDYDKARDSFIDCTSYNSDYDIAYNNAAICSYYLKDFENAKKYQKQAIDTFPAVEYYYNLGRVYETLTDFEFAVKYYMAVIKGAANISCTEYVDPVHINNKVLRLFPNKRVLDRASDDVVFALRLKDYRDVLMLEDSNMDIKGGSFKANVNAIGDNAKLKCIYDAKDADPYHLINSLYWIVKSEGKIIYTGKDSSFSIKIQKNKKYTISLDITYSGNKKKSSSQSVFVKGNEKGKPGKVNIDDNKKDNVDTKPIVQLCKFYDATYEQVFAKDFLKNSRVYNDRFNVGWGKDGKVETEIMEKDIQDSGTALRIKNTADGNAGIWANLTNLLNDKQLKGKKINIKLWARKISNCPNMNMTFRVRAYKIYSTSQDFELDYRWQQLSMNVNIPYNATGLTFSLNVNPGEEIKIDGFVITIID